MKKTTILFLVGIALAGLSLTLHGCGKSGGIAPGVTILGNSG